MSEHISLAEYRATVAAQTLENSVQRDILTLLAARNIPHAVTDASASYNANGQRRKRVTTGWPDITACFPGTGQLLAIECKRASGGRLRPEQAATLETLWTSGALILIARSVEDVERMLETGKVPHETLEEVQAARSPKRKATR